MQKGALFIAAYLIALPVLNVFHFIEHHHHEHEHHHDHHDEGHPAISETPHNCNFCYVYQNQKVVDSHVEGIFLVSTFSPFLEGPTASLISTSSYYISLRAPPSSAV